jgi:hypothetical protein
MKHLLSFTIFLFAVLTTVNQGKAQDFSPSDKKFRLELEPYTPLFARGVSGSILYAVDKENKLSVGLYSATMDVPKFTMKDIFENVDPDVSKVRLGFQLSASVRYKLNVFKNMESNPYVGLMFGWQYFDVTQEPLTDPVRLTTMLITPNFGYEFYFFRQRVYINPQVRGVIYAGQSTNNTARPEAIGSFYVLPQIVGGIRF